MQLAINLLLVVLGHVAIITHVSFTFAFSLFPLLFLPCFLLLLLFRYFLVGLGCLRVTSYFYGLLSETDDLPHAKHLAQRDRETNIVITSLDWVRRDPTSPASVTLLGPQTGILPQVCSSADAFILKTWLTATIPFLRTDSRSEGTKVCAHHQIASEAEWNPSTSASEKFTLDGSEMRSMAPRWFAKRNRQAFFMVKFSFLSFHAGYLEVQCSQCVRLKQQL